MDSVGQCSDGAGLSVGGIVADDAPTCSILLVSDAHGSMGSGN